MLLVFLQPFILSKCQLRSSFRYHNFMKAFLPFSDALSGLQMRKITHCSIKSLENILILRSVCKSEFTANFEWPSMRENAFWKQMIVFTSRNGFMLTAKPWPSWTQCWRVIYRTLPSQYCIEFFCMTDSNLKVSWSVKADPMHVKPGQSKSGNVKMT